MSRCVTVSLGLVDYLEALELQRRLHQRVAEGLLSDTLLLLEHPHVYTLGRRGKASDVLATTPELSEIGAEVHHVDRGGEVTYHGPGQLVGYPVVNLRVKGGGPLAYVQDLEDALVSTLADFGIAAGVGDRPTGVWVGDAKVAAIGVKVSRGVTMHGFALNVDPDLSYFDHIVPCGMPDGRVTSMSAELSRAVEVREVVPVLADHLGRSFGWMVSWAAREELEQEASVP